MGFEEFGGRGFELNGLLLPKISYYSDMGKWRQRMIAAQPSCAQKASSGPDERPA